MTWGQLVTEIGGTLFRLNHLPQKKIIAALSSMTDGAGQEAIALLRGGRAAVLR